MGIVVKKGRGGGTYAHKDIAFRFAAWLSAEKVIRYVEANGYMENAALMKPPFDRPTAFIRLFDDQQQSALIQAINQLRDNAERVSAS